MRSSFVMPQLSSRYISLDLEAQNQYALASEEKTTAQSKHHAQLGFHYDVLKICDNKAPFTLIFLIDWIKQDNFAHQNSIQMVNDERKKNVDMALPKRQKRNDHCLLGALWKTSSPLPNCSGRLLRQ